MQLSPDEVLAIASRASQPFPLYRGGTAIARRVAAAGALAAALLYAGCVVSPDDSTVVPDGDGPAAVTITVTDTDIADRDNDGVPDPTDNCPDQPNSDQIDFDFDGVGNVCDPGFGTGVHVSGGGCQSSGGTSGAVLLVLGWLAVARSRHRRAA